MKKVIYFFNYILTLIAALILKPILSRQFSSNGILIYKEVNNIGLIIFSAITTLIVCYIFHYYVLKFANNLFFYIGIGILNALLFFTMHYFLYSSLFNEFSIVFGFFLICLLFYFFFWMIAAKFFNKNLSKFD